MRSIAFLILTAVVTVFMTAGILSAEEEADSPAATTPARKMPGGFAPSEEVKADTAIAFPTDI